MTKIREAKPRLLNLLWVVLVIGSMAIAQNAKDAPYIKPAQSDKTISLQIAVIVGAPGPTVSFTMTNNSTSEIDATDPGIDPSRIVVIKPDGEEFEQYASVSLVPGATLPKLKPSESKSWKFNLSDLFTDNGRFKEPGTYRLYWKYGYWKDGKDLVVYKSNEISLLKEKKGN